MKKSVVFCLAILLCCVSFLSSTVAQEKQSNVFGQGLAVDIRLERISVVEIKKLAVLGFHNVRIGINWPEVERKQGEYIWDARQKREPMADGLDDEPAFSYDEMIELLHGLNVHISTILFFGNKLYTGPLVKVGGDEGYFIPAAPHTPEAIQAFANFAVATVRHYSNLYGSHAFTWLIWNEPDTDGGFPPKADGAIVGEFVVITCQNIKKAVPDARVMAPALGVKDGGAFRYDFIRDLFAHANPLACLDAFTVHPYRPFPPETVLADYDKLMAFLRPWQPQHPVPLAVDEWGYPLPSPKFWHHLSWRDYTLEEQAALQLRSYLINLAAGIPLTVLYEWRDSGPDPDNNEHTYGMNTYDGKEKPAIVMWRNVMSQLKGRKLLENLRLSACSPHVHVMRFDARSESENEEIVVWTETRKDKAYLSGNFENITDVFGQRINPDDHSVKLSSIPMLIDMKSKNISTLTCRTE